MKAILSLLLVFQFGTASAQDFLWVDHSGSDAPNPRTATILREGNNHTLWTARTDSCTQYYTPWIMGRQMVEQRDTDNVLLRQISIGPEASVLDLQHLPNGDLIVAGTFIGEVIINGLDTVSQGNTIVPNSYLTSIDPAGNVNWSLNLMNITGGYFSVAQIAIDPDGDIWYSMENFNDVWLREVDVNGDSLQKIFVDNARTIGDFDFDAWGNMYLTGGTGNGNFTIGNYSVVVPETYMIFVARLNASGVCTWTQLAHDVTFQTPDLCINKHGVVYVIGDLFDSLSWGPHHLQGKDWGYDFFLVKMDSSGAVLWAKEAPNPPTITGDFRRGAGSPIAVNDRDEVLMGGVLRGSVNWGNGQLSDTGIPLGSGSGFNLVVFDANGTAIRQKSVGSVAPKIMGDVLFNNHNNYFTASHQQETLVNFDSLQVNFNKSNHFLVARLSLPNTTGMVETFKDDGIVLWPNPAREVVNIPAHWTGGKEVDIYALDGRLVKVVTTKSTAIDVQSLPAGIYFLRCEGEGARLVVE